MPNQTSPIPAIFEGTNAVRKINEYFDAAGTAMTGGRNAAGITGPLKFAVFGGRAGGVDGVNTEVTLTASTTNYVVWKKSDGVVSVSTSPTNWNNAANYWRLYSVIAGVGTVADYTDERLSAEGIFGGGGGGGGGGAVSSVNGQTGAVVLDAADLDYDNTTSGLTATDVQAAIDEIAAGAGGGAIASVNGATGVVVLDAGDIGIADAGSYFTGADSEAALQELGASRAGLSETIDDRVAALLVAGTNISLTYNDGANTLTIAATGSAGGINAQTGTTYTGVLADAGKTVTMANAASNVLTVPPNSSVAYPVGTQIGVRMTGAGQTSVAPGVGVIVNAIESLQLLKQGAVAVLEQTATDVWYLTGELKPQTPAYRSKQRFDPSNATTAGTVQGVAFTSAGTVSHPTQATTSLQTAIRRTRWATAASAGAGGGIRETVATKLRGNATGIGGFRAEFRFDQSTDVGGHQVFVGLANSVAALAGDPSALTNMIGLGYDSGDAAGSNWILMHNDASGTATRDSLTGAGGVNGMAACARDNATVLLLTIEAPANGSTVLVSLVNETSGATILNRQTYSTDLPVSTSLLALHVQNRTGATTTAGQIEVASIDVGYQE